MSNIYKFLGGRKLFFAVALTIISLVLIFTGDCDCAQWLDFQKWIYGAFALGNMGEHVANKFK